MSITRRNLMISGLMPFAAALGQDKPSRLSKREIDQLTRALRKANGQDIPAYIRSLKELEPVLEFDKRYLEKYGFTTVPKVFINPDFQYRSFTYDDSRAAPIVKNEKYMDNLFNLYREIRLLVEDLRNYSFQNGDVNGLLPDLDLLVQNPALKRTFTIDLNGKKVNISSAQDLISFIHSVAIHDVEAADSDFVAFARYDYFALVDALRKSAPKMALPLKDASSVGKTLEELLEGVVRNYKDASPVLVVYPDEKEFEAKTGQKGAAAFHRPFSDTVETYGKERFVHMFELPHEVGHVLARNQEESIADRIRSEYRSISTMYGLVVERQKAIEMLAKLKKEKNPQEIADLNDKIEISLTYIRSITRMLNLQALAQALASRFKNLLEFFGSAHSDFLDETSAYLFQDIVLTNFAQSNPRIGTLMLQYRDAHSMEQDAEHHGAYMLARELKKKHNGDSLAAFREIAYLIDEGKIEAYRKKIQQYNDERFSSVTVGPLARLDQLRKRIDVNESIGHLIEEWRLHEGDSDYTSAARQRILVTQKRVADLFGQYINLTIRAPS